MGRTKEFDQEFALDVAVEVFREHGFEGTSAGMLVGSMKIGRQSLYNAFGDKWQLYLSALRRYGMAETSAHLVALRSQPKAIDGIKAAIDRVVSEARSECLGVSSVCEFGSSKPDVNKIRAAADRSLRAAFIERVREAQRAGDLSGELDPDSAVDFLWGNFAGIRIAARGGAPDSQLQALGQLALRALR